MINSRSDLRFLDHPVYRRSLFWGRRSCRKRI